MSMLKRIIFASFVTVAMFSITAAQDSVNSVAQKSTVTITAAAFADRIRVTAPASVVQMRVELFATSGEKVLDQEIKSGNVFDWQLPGGQQLPAGRYVCVVTARSISGRLTQRLGAVNVNDQALSVEPADAAQLSAPQVQAIGLVEENSSWTVLGSDEIQTPTVIAHDGTDGQLTRGRGALTFRFGDFFSGNDTEQMRLTEEGNLGIGTDKPKVKLDVVGMISAREGFRFADGSTLNVNDKGVLTRTTASGELVPNIAGTGTQNKLAKWLDNAGTLGDSVVTEASGNIGIGTPSPQAALHVIGNQFLKPLGATPTYKVLAGSDPTSTVMLTTDSSVFGWQIAPSNAPSDTIVQVLGQSFASVPNRGEFGIYLGADGNSAFKVIQRGGAELMRVNRVGTVGIGTTNPAEKLEVAGNIKASGSLMGGTGSVTGNLTVDTNTLHVDAATNRVGIGTVTPTESLHVVGNELVTGNLSVNGNLSVAGEFSAALPAGSNNYIQNSTAAQSSSDFNISGNGTAGGTLSANIVSATQQYNFGAERVLAISGSSNTNTFVGVGAGAANPTGGSNSFFGKDAGAANTTGASNSFFGLNAGNSNTTGFSNSFFGGDAGKANTTGFTNSFFGRSAGAANTTGNNNSFFGLNAGVDNTTGASNSFFGVGAGDSNTTGGSNSFFGLSAGNSNTTGGSNSFFGRSAGLANTTGSDNTIIGHNADVGSNNLTFATALGADAVVNANDTIVLGKVAGTYSGAERPADAVLVPGNLTVSGTLTATLPTGSGNYIQNTSSPQASSDFNISGNGTAGGTLSANIVRATTQYNFGVDRVLAISGSLNTNTFVGVGAGAANPSGGSNSFFGKDAGAANTSGSGNSFFGVNAGGANTIGINNSFFGREAGKVNTTGASNSFFGRSAGGSNTTGDTNSFFGVSAGQANTTGDSNSFFGVFAGQENTTGTVNSFFGKGAGDSNTTGGSNSFFGRGAGEANTTGSNNTIIGDIADVGSNNLTFATALGANAVVNANDTIVLGKVAGTYSGVARPADTVRVPGKILAEANAGGTAAVGVGEYYRDNAIVAWAKISASGTLLSGFGIATVAHTTTGIYTITLTASAVVISFPMPVAIAEISSAPTSAATLRIVSIKQTSANSFQVFINNGTGALVDNDFVFIATAR